MVGATQRLVNFDQYFSSLTTPVVVVNDVPYTVKEKNSMLMDKMMTMYSNDQLSALPTCGCGTASSRQLLGTTCPVCNEPYTDITDEVHPVLWLRTLDPNVKFMNTTFWTVLSKTINVRVDYLQWLTDPNVVMTKKIPPYVYGIVEVMGGRNYSNFCNNVVNILKYLLTHPSFSAPKKQRSLLKAIDLYLHNQDNIYSNYLPIMNKKVFVVKNTNKGKLTNLAVAEVINIVLSWSKASSRDDLSLTQVNNLTAKVVHNLAKLGVSYFEKYVVGKPGALRKHVYGARGSLTFRTVVTSIPGKHFQNEIHVPWTVGVVVYRPHLLNYLLRDGYTYKEASKILLTATKKYTPLMEKYLNRLIEESGYELGLPVIEGRNPGLLQGSMQLKFITRFKTNVSDLATSTSILSAKPSNADFDGDQLYYILILDRHLYDLLKNFEVHHSVPDFSSPHSVSGLVTLEQSGNDILSHYLRGTNDAGTDTVLELI